jgi:hypothetical protein
MKLKSFYVVICLLLSVTFSTIWANEPPPRKEPKIALTLGEVQDELLVSVHEGRTHRALLTKLTNSQPTHLLVGFSNMGVIGLVGYPQLTGPNQFALFVRARHLFVSDQVALLNFECPMDSQSECDNAYRTSDAFLGHLNATIEMVKQKMTVEKLSIVGFGYGSINAVFAAEKLTPQSLILISPPDTYEKQATLTQSSYLRHPKLEKLGLRTMVFAHSGSGCTWTNFDNAARMSRGVAFIEVSGFSRVDSRDRSGCVNLGPHGMVGREREVGFATLNFVEGFEQVPSQIK